MLHSLNRDAVISVSPWGVSINGFDAAENIVAEKSSINTGHGNRYGDVLAALTASIGAIKNRRTGAVVILSNNFIRYQVVPWNAAIVNHDEEIGFVRYRYEMIFGAMVNDWEFRLSTAVYGQQRLASAVDKGFITSIMQVIKGARCTLKSIRPRLMHDVNQLFSGVKGGDCRIVHYERGRVVVGVVKDGVWVSVRQARLNAEFPDMLVDFINRDVDMSDLKSREMRVYVVISGPCWADMNVLTEAGFAVMKGA